MPWMPTAALDALTASVETQRQSFERTLAVLREEVSTLTRALGAAHLRTDNLLTDLAKSFVVQATPVPTAPASLPRRRTTPDPIRGLGNVLDPVKLGDPEGEFDSVRAASLMAAEDEEPDAATAA